MDLENCLSGEISLQHMMKIRRSEEKQKEEMQAYKAKEEALDMFNNDKQYYDLIDYVNVLAVGDDSIKPEFTSFQGDRFYVNPRCRNAFWTIYRDCFEDELSISLLQPRQYDSMLTVDIDIMAKTNKPVPLYSLDDVKHVVSIYHSVMKSITDEKDDKYFDCILLSKEPYVKVTEKETIVKHGFHLQFLNYFCDLETRKYIRETVQKQCTKYEIDNTDSTPWMVFGSKKPNQKSYYKPCYVFQINGTIIPWKKADLSRYSLPEKVEGNVSEQIPALFSTNPYGRYTVKIDTKEMYKKKIQIEELKKTIIEPKEKNNNLQKSSGYDELERILNLLSVEKADDRDSWLKVAMILKNQELIDKVQENTYYPLFNEFSSRSSKYDEDACEKLYLSLKPRDTNRVTAGTLKYWIKNQK